MRELTLNEVEMVSGGGDGSEITSEEAMALSTYYAGMGALSAGFGVTAGFAPVFFALSAGFAFYSII
jgi:hypothetical protein